MSRRSVTLACMALGAAWGFAVNGTVAAAATVLAVWKVAHLLRVLSEVGDEA